MLTEGRRAAAAAAAAAAPAPAQPAPLLHAVVGAGWAGCAQVRVGLP